jgi:hypothetical protein
MALYINLPVPQSVKQSYPCGDGRETNESELSELPLDRLESMPTHPVRLQ